MTFNVCSVNDYESLMVDGAQLIDVREPGELASQGTLPGAINIPISEFVDRLAEIDKSRPVVLLCRSGGRSAQAAEYLVNLGYGPVTNLVGGIMAYAA